jgi:cytochrome P450
MAAVVDDELDRWRPGTVRDLRDDMTFLTLRIVARCLVGENVTDRGEGGIGALIQRTLRLGLKPAVFLLPVDVPGLPYRRFLDAVEKTDRAVQKAIASRRAGETQNHDMLAMLLQARCEDGSGLTEDHIIEHTGVMFIAGQETSANALIWTVLLLSQHPSVAADLLDEIEGKGRGGAPSAEQIDELPFLDAVVRESLRVLPPVPMNARIVARDTELRGYALPAGAHLLVSLYHTHRSPDVFHDPNRFDPRRWESCKPAAYEFSPFGVGPRTCIGAQFAVMEIKLVLAMLLRRFRLEFIPDTRVDRATVITMSVKGRLPMRINPQDRQFARGVGGIKGNVRDMVDFGR